MLYSLITSILIILGFVLLLWIFSDPEDLYPDFD